MIVKSRFLLLKRGLFVVVYFFYNPVSTIIYLILLYEFFVRLSIWISKFNWRLNYILSSLPNITFLLSLCSKFIVRFRQS